MSLQLPPVSISLLADVSKLTAGVRQAEQIVNQAAGQLRPMQIRVDGAGATREVTALIAQLRTLTSEMRAQEAANGQQRASIAAMVAQQAALRAQLSQTIENLRANGASARELATANGTLRTSMLTATAAIAEQRKELASGVAAQAQYRGAISQTRDQLRQLEGDTNRAAAAQRAQSSSGSSGRGVSGGAGGTLLTGAVLGVGAMAGREVFNLVTAGAGAAKDAIIGFNSSMEQSKIAFTTFLGGAQQADQFLQQLVAFANKTPFAFPDLVMASQRLMAMGYTAQQVIPLMTDIGNTAAAMGKGKEGVDVMVTALGQMKAAVVLHIQDLNQMIAVGVPVWDILSKAMGKPVPEIQKMVEGGKVLSSTFTDAFSAFAKQNYGDMMEKQSKTFTGSMSNIKDAVSQTLAKIGEPLYIAISRVASALAKFLTTPQFAAWANAAQQAVQSVIGLLGQLFSMATQVAGALGFSMPKIDMAKPDDATFQTQEVAANNTAVAQAEAARQAAGYAAEVTAAEGHLKEINAQLSGVKDAQDAITNQIADIKQGYADQIQPLERQIAVINQLSDAEKARSVRRNELEGQEIQIKLSMPDVSGIDDAIQQLNRDKQDLGKFDSSQWDTALAGLHDQLNQIAHEDTKTLDHAMQAVQESLYELGRENTKALDAQIAGLQKNIADLGKHATDGLDKQIQSLHDKIDGLSTVAIDDLDRQAKALKERVAGISTASIDAIDVQVQGLRDKIDAISTASIDALDKQLAGLQDRLKGFNTDDLDRQIAHLQAKMNEPVADTSGMTNQLTLLASQLGGPGDEAARQQFAGLSAQKAGILSAQALRQNAFKQQLASLEAERTAQKLANDDAKATIQNQIDGIDAQKKGLVDLNTERRKGWEAEIKALELAKRGEVERNAATKAGLESQIKSIEERKQGLVDANTEAKKGWESQIKGLEATKKGIEERIAGQKEAMQATLDGLQATKKGIDDERANRRDALQDQLHGMQETKRLADEDRANRRQAIQEQIDGITKEKDAAKAVFDQNIAAIDENIRALTRQKEDALAPYNAALARIGKEKEIIGLLDQQDALTRKIAEAPLKERIEALKLAEQDALDPLERQQKVLERQTRELEGQKRQWDEIKQKATDAGKAMVPPDPTVGTKGLPDTGAEGFIGPVEKTGLALQIAEASEKIRQFNDYLREHPGLVRAAVIALGALVGVFGLLKLGLAVTEGVLAIGPALAALISPVGIVLVVLAGLALTFKLLYDHCRPFHDAINEILFVFKEKGLGAAFAKVGEDLGKLGQFIVDFAKDAAPKFLAQLGEWGKALIAWIGPRIVPFLEELGKLEVAYLRWLGDRVGPIAAQLLKWAAEFIAWVGPKTPPLLEELGKLSLRLLGWIGEQSLKLLEKLGEWGLQFAAWVGPKIPPLLVELGTLMLRLLGWIAEKIPELALQLLKWAGEFIAWVAPHIPKLLAELVLLFARLLGWVAEQIPALTVQMLVWGVEFIAWVAKHIPLLIIEVDTLIARLLRWIIEQIPSIVTHMAKWGLEFLQWIIDVVPKLPGELANALLTIGLWVDTKAIPFLKNAGGQIVSAFMEGFSGLADNMRGPINQGIGLINGFLKGIEGAVHAIGDFFDLGSLKGFTIVQIGTIQGGASRGGGGGGGDAALAVGTDNWRGGPAIVGEAGRELVKRTPGPLARSAAEWELISKPTLIPDLPAGATVLPNNVTERLLAAGIPGFAFGLGDILGGAKDLLGNAKDALGNLLGMGIEKVTSAVTDHIPHLDLPGMMKPVGDSLAGSAAKGVVDLVKSLWGKLHHDAPKGSGGAGGAGIAGSGELIAAILAATSDTAEQTAMLLGAFIETGGRNVPQIGGGPGAGYWQIEAGPGGQYAGQVDPYDAKAAARFMIPDYDAAMRYYDPHNLENSLVQVVVHAERPKGLRYDNDRIANAWDAIQQYLVKGGGIVGTGETSGSGQFVNPVPGIRAVQGSWTHGGTHDREAAVDWAAPYGTAIHAVDAGRAYTVWNGDGATGNTGMMDHGNGWITYYGHVSDFGEGGFGRDSIVGRTGSPEQNGGAGSGAHLHFAMRLNGAYERPEDNIPGIFGLANGGFFPANDGRLAVIGEGAHPEIVAPVPMMKQSVKDAITELGRTSTGIPARAANRRADRDGEEITVVFEAGSISIDKDGTPTVNRKPLTLRQARIEAGIAG